ncbi:NagC Transcriptional regulator/sugar kinase [actinobacterium SCGC AAA044-D11]|uniref:Glucokinase n=1 Tax=freshwater metagenome TaxID=449393 RepID=A0A6J6BMH4_9ZZZZ|nr:ROK family glucokinase [Actinomycetota bacterium]MTA24874.1 ROK family glucokinase [Actinomycetota bacterium]
MLNSKLAIGIDIGGTKVLGGVVNQDGEILRTFRVDTPKTGGDALNQSIADVITELLTTHNTDSIGISAAGLVSSDRATMLGSPNIKDWDGVNIAAELLNLCGAKTVVENDANCAAWAERVYGAGKGLENVIMITVGTGIGGAAIVNGQPLRGANGTGAEFGHMRIVPDGEQCGCGIKGCYERYASGSALMRHAREAIAKDPVAARNLLSRGDGTIEGLLGGHITEAARDGDRIAIEALATTGDWLGAGIATLSMLFDPSIVVIGGGVIDAGEFLLEPARKAMMREMPFVGKHPVPEIVSAKLGNDAGLVGVADLARN